MTKKEFWLKLFSENDTALASALILVEHFERYVNVEQLERGNKYIRSEVQKLYEEMPEDVVKSVFPDYNCTIEEDPELRFCESCVHFEYCQPCDGSGVGICEVDGVEVFGGSLAGECWKEAKLNDK